MSGPSRTDSWRGDVKLQGHGRFVAKVSPNFFGFSLGPREVDVGNNDAGADPPQERVRAGHPASRSRQ